jgi:hypothetical protein
MKRLKAGEGDKWTRKRLKQLRREIEHKWRELGAALGAMNDVELSETLAILSKTARPAVYGWQEEATRQIEYAHLLGDKPKGSSASANPNLELIEQRKSEQEAMTAARRAERIRERDAAARAYEQYVHTAEGRAEQDPQKRLSDFYAKYPQYKAKKPTRKQQAEQARRQREQAAKFVPVPIPQTSKILSLAGAERNDEGEIVRVIRGKVNLTPRELHDYLRKQGYTMTLQDVRRFVRDTLKVKMRSEQGKRTDLKNTFAKTALIVLALCLAF